MIIKNTENLDKRGLAATKAVESGISATTISDINSLASFQNGVVEESLQTTIQEQISNFIRSK